MTRLFLLFHFPFLSFMAQSQVSEQFADGEFSVNPSWTGTSSAWTVNSILQLQSSHNVTNSGFYLSTPNNMGASVQWDWYLRLSFNTSSNNYVDIFLLASSADLSAPNLSGYFVRI